MAKLSKRAQVEALGWTFKAVPHFFAAGALWHSPETGQQSPASWDHKNPDAWIATPPPGFPAGPRRFDNRSPIPAVRWAWDQAMAPRLQGDLGGVAGLVALMGEARRAGVVADGVDVGCSLPARPDAELLALCGEVMGARRIEEGARGTAPCPWTDREGFRSASDRVSEAHRAQERLMPRVVEVGATTPAGVVAKARAIELMFASSRGRRSAAVRALVADLVAVLGQECDRAPT